MSISKLRKMYINKMKSIAKGNPCQLCDSSGENTERMINTNSVRPNNHNTSIMDKCVYMSIFFINLFVGNSSIKYN